MNDIDKLIQSLAEKASKAEKSEDALRFSQAALNLGNANVVLLSAKKAGGTPFASA